MSLLNILYLIGSVLALLVSGVAFRGTHKVKTSNWWFIFLTAQANICLLWAVVFFGRTNIVHWSASVQESLAHGITVSGGVMAFLLVSHFYKNPKSKELPPMNLSVTTAPTVSKNAARQQANKIKTALYPAKKNAGSRVSANVDFCVGQNASPVVQIRQRH